MKFLQASAGRQIAAAFGLILVLLGAITLTSLWRLQASAALAQDLVEHKLARQQLTSDLLSTVRLNALRTLSVARADSLEVADIFLAELAKGDQVARELATRLDASAADDTDRSLQQAVLAAGDAYWKVRKDVLRQKEMGRLQQVDEMVNGALQQTYQAHLAALSALLKHQQEGAAQRSADARNAFQRSWIVIVTLGLAALLAGSALAWRLTHSVTDPLQKAVEVARKVAQGNLQVKITHRRRDEFGALLDALAEMSARLSTTVARVRDSSHAIDSASHEVADGNLDLSRRTEHQAGTLQETAAAMVELTTTVRENSASARNAHALAEQAATSAASGGRVVSELVSTMENIDGKASRILDIISVIDGIAFQTNILALNAAVEAARAGEQGRGFAVVASEVRSLAQRSATAAQEIKQLITDSVSTISEGNVLAASAGSAMEGMLASVRQVAQIMAGITAAAQSQELGITEISAAIADIDSDTQRNGALVEEAAAAAEALTAQAKSLASLMQQFTLQADTSHELAGPMLAQRR